MSECSEYQNGRCASGWVVNAPGFCAGRVEVDTCQHCGESTSERVLPSCLMDDPPEHWINDKGLPRGWPGEAK